MSQLTEQINTAVTMIVQDLADKGMDSESAAEYLRNWLATASENEDWPTVAAVAIVLAIDAA